MMGRRSREPSTALQRMSGAPLAFVCGFRARPAQKSHFREPRTQPVAQRPGDAEVERHCLTHVPYAPWCEYCIAHRARPDRHERSDLSKESSIPTVSFDFCFTKALEGDEKEADVSSSTWLVMADSHSGYLGCCPLRGKGQIKLATHEIMAFTQSWGIQQFAFPLTMSPQRVRS